MLQNECSLGQPVEQHFSVALLVSLNYVNFISHFVKLLKYSMVLHYLYFEQENE